MGWWLPEAAVWGIREILVKPQWFLTFWHQGSVTWKTVFPQMGVEGWFGDDSITFIVQLLLSHQLHLRSSGMRSWRLGTLGLKDTNLQLVLININKLMEI